MSIALSPATTHVPMLLDIKGDALDDGPGIRSVVFFKGCPLSCAWCQNPESRRSTPELAFDIAACIAGCTSCLENCPKHALDRRNPDFVDRSECDVCFACVGVCPSAALSRIGRPVSLDDLMRTLRRDKPFYDTSGGGVTFSGGEPTLHMKFLGRLAAACRAEGIHTLLETCGQFRWERFERNVLPHIDMIYYDLKVLDSDAHREFCGVANDRILENFARLARLSLAGEFELLARVPLVPGITATEGNVLAIGRFLLAHGIDRVRLLDYNPTWVDKMTKLGASNDFARQAPARTWLAKEVATTMRAKLGEHGVTAL